MSQAYAEKAEGRYAEDEMNIPAENKDVIKAIRLILPPRVLRIALNCKKS